MLVEIMKNRTLNESQKYMSDDETNFYYLIG